jgi:hypothetical protein
MNAAVNTPAKARRKSVYRVSNVEMGTMSPNPTVVDATMVV